MTPDELAKHGLRVTPLAWYSICTSELGYTRWMAEGFCLYRADLAEHGSGWDFQGKWYPIINQVKDIAEADHAAHIAAALEPIAPPFFSKASFADFTDANDVGDEILLHGQPGKCRAAPPDVAQAARVQHIKRGSIYKVIGRGILQTDTPLNDYAPVVIYQCETDGKIWVRNEAEFDDGRFAALCAIADGETP